MELRPRIQSGFPAGEGRRGETARIVARDIGALQMLLSAAMLVPLLVSILYGEWYSALALAAAAAAGGACGWLAYRLCRDAGDPDRHHAMIIAAAGWLISAGFGALPFLFAAHWTPSAVAQAFVPPGETYVSSLLHFRNPLHAFFESMSAYTTTGLTMAVHEPSIGRGLLFFRSMSQWIGGVGVIVLSLAIIPRPRAVGGLELYQSETAGMKLRPSILGTARAIWKIYGTLTAVLIIYLFAATLIILPGYGIERSLFDAINHAMTGLSTGGFSPLDDSIAGYNSYSMDIIHLLPMILGVTAIPLYYTFLREKDLRVFRRDPQFRMMVVLFTVITPFLGLLLLGSPAVSDAFRESLFQVVSAVSGTGWQTSNIGEWGNGAVLLLAFGTMVVGGAAGSTAGGFKLIRAYVLLHAVAWRVRKVFLPPQAVLPFRIGARRVPSQAMQREVADAAVFSFLYLAVLGGSIVLVAHLAGPEFTLGDAVFESVSAQGTVGLSTGITHPAMPATVELIFIIQMWVGRLEIFPVLVLLNAFIVGMRR